MESITTIPNRRNNTIDLTTSTELLYNYSDLSVGVSIIIWKPSERTKRKKVPV